MTIIEIEIEMVVSPVGKIILRAYGYVVPWTFKRNLQSVLLLHSKEKKEATLAYLLYFLSSCFANALNKNKKLSPECLKMKGSKHISLKSWKSDSDGWVRSRRPTISWSSPVLSTMTAFHQSLRLQSGALKTFKGRIWEHYLWSLCLPPSHFMQYCTMRPLCVTWQSPQNVKRSCLPACTWGYLADIH